jgi:NAD(P)-dependent dehydrogenase (short-subunit alcohol dehydrogenase family)
VNLVRIGAPFVRDGGALILTTGVLSEHPIPGSSIVTTVNAAVDGFVRAAAIEVGRGVRVAAVSPGWISETMEAMGMDSSAGLPAVEVARVYARLLDEDVTGCSVVAAKGM